MKKPSSSSRVRCATASRGGLDAHRVHGGKVDRLERFGERLASVCFLVLVIAVRERDRVFGTDQRTATFDVGQLRRAVAGDEGQVHRGAFAIRFRLGLEEIGVAVDEEQAVAATPSKREHRAQHDRAITAQNDRKLARVQHRFHRVGELGRPRRDGPGIEGARLGVGRGVLRRHRQPPGASRMDALCKTERKQLVGQALHAVRRQAQRGRGFENCVAKRRHDWHGACVRGERSTITGIARRMQLWSAYRSGWRIHAPMNEPLPMVSPLQRDISERSSPQRCTRRRKARRW